jgi:hypothetical protein
MRALFLTLLLVTLSLPTAVAEVTADAKYRFDDPFHLTASYVATAPPKDAPHQRFGMDTDRDGNISAEEAINGTARYREQVASFGSALGVPGGLFVLDDRRLKNLSITDAQYEGLEGPVMSAEPVVLRFTLQVTFDHSNNTTHKLVIQPQRANRAGSWQMNITSGSLIAPPGFRINFTASRLPAGGMLSKSDTELLLLYGVNPTTGTTNLTFEPVPPPARTSPLPSPVPILAGAALVAVFVHRRGRTPKGNKAESEGGPMDGHCSPPSYE